MLTPHSDPKDEDRTRPESSTGASKTPTIVVGVDGSDTSLDALSWACGEARRISGRAIAVLVSPIPGAKMIASASPLASLASSEYLECEASLETELVNRLRSELPKLADHQDVDLVFMHTHGDVASELLRVAAENRAQLIAVGRSTKPRHRVAGSLGHRLLRHHDAPIIVVVP
jgi:nucleotide-binding universal stress UspA family protein